MLNDFNFAFFGSPEFAAIILQKLIDVRMLPRAVVCNPDRPVGRKKIITPPPTKLLAQKYNIPVLQPEVLLISNFQSLISKVDLFIVAAYAKIIPKGILEIPRLGTIGVHPSLLPRHRGATPIQTAILEGDKITGLTLYLLDEKMDHGPLLARRELQIANQTYEELEKELAKLGAELLIETLPRFINGEVKPEPQNETQATYTKKFKTDDAFVKVEALRQAQDGASPEDAEMIVRKVRALNPEPGVFTLSPSKGGPKRMKILEAELKEERLILKKIQFEGGKAQNLN